MEDGVFLPYVVPVEGTQGQKFREPRKDAGGAHVHFLLFSFYFDSYVYCSLSD
jgi:hypothetical protein